MKFKKKFLSALLMLTCVFALTACGNSETDTEFQDLKVQNAEQLASYAVDLTVDLVQSGDADTLLSRFSNVELATVYGNYFAQTYGYNLVVEGKGIRSAFTSFADSIEKIGEIKEFGTPDSLIDDDVIIVNIPVAGSEMNGSVELIFSNDIYFVMKSCTMNIEETFGSLMAKAGLNTLIGMGTVFLVLILISFIISAFGVIPKIQDKFKKKEEPAKVETTVATPVEQEEELTDDTELVAVIAAAIAAYEGTSADGFTVRSIKRANTKKWQRA